MLPDIPEANALLFIWNANSGWSGALVDTLHKYFRPETYSCNLCMLTHGSFGPKAEWKQFLKEQNYPMYFLHRDEFIELEWASHHKEITFPAVFQFQGESWVQVFSSEKVASLQSLHELILLLRTLEDRGL